MCTRLWQEIEYKEVPSVAMSRYTNAFGRHDSERLEKYKEAVRSGEQTIPAGALFPHDCARTAREGDKEIADLQFEALPNILSALTNVLCICVTAAALWE